MSTIGGHIRIVSRFCEISLRKVERTGREGERDARIFETPVELKVNRLLNVHVVDLPIQPLGSEACK